MRIVIHLNDYDPNDTEIVHDQHKVSNPSEAADQRAVVDGFDTEWYPGGGNVHVVDDRIKEAAERLDGSVRVEQFGGFDHVVENAEIVTVYADE